MFLSRIFYDYSFRALLWMPTPNDTRPATQMELHERTPPMRNASHAACRASNDQANFRGLHSTLKRFCEKERARQPANHDV